MIIVKKIKALILTLMEYHVFLAVANGSFITRKLKQLKRIIKLETNTVIDKRNTKFDGRNVSPNENTIFQAENQLGSVEICDTGWNNQQNRITPEEVEEQVDELRVEVKEIKSDVEKLTSNLNIID